MNMNEKLAYLKGVKDAIDISSKSTDKVLNAIIDLLDSIVEEVNDIRDMSSDTDSEFDAIYEGMDNLGDRLDDIEDQLDDISDTDFECYEDDNDTECCGDCNSCDCCDCDDPEGYSYLGDFSVEHGEDVVFTCPNCGETVIVKNKSLELLNDSNSLIITCKECGKEFKVYGSKS